MKKRIFLFVIYILSLKVHSITELSCDYNYNQQVFGVNRENSVTTKGLNIGIAIYFSQLMGIEINGGQTESVTTINEIVSLDSNYSFNVIKQESSLVTNSYGIGIRMSFAGKKASIRPMFSVGYASQKVISNKEITFKDKVSNVNNIISGDELSNKYDSIYSTFSVKFSLTNRLSLRTSVSTTFPAFDFNKAKDYLKYSLGFSVYI